MCMGGEKGKKKDVHPKRTNFLKIMLKYETDQLKPKSAASVAKSIDANAKQTINDAKPTVIFAVPVIFIPICFS